MSTVVDRFSDFENLGQSPAAQSRCVSSRLQIEPNYYSCFEADSKVLTESKREELYENLLADNLMGWAVDVLDPRDLSAQMLRR